jgi:hypothetical protein
MMMGGKIRLAGPRLEGAYWIDKKDGYVSTAYDQLGFVAIYCKIKDGEIVGCVEVVEDKVTREEQISFKYGLWRDVVDHFLITYDNRFDSNGDMKDIGVSTFVNNK